MNNAEPPIPADATPPVVAAPTANRVISLDVLRGLAVLGILVMNIQSFSMMSAAYSNPMALGQPTGVDYWVWLLCHLFADLKFITLFSLLFGAGIVMMAERCRATGRSAAWLHYRRLFWLLLIGAVHAYGVWYGDVLVIYAMCGAILFWAWRLPAGWLIALAAVFLLIGSALTLSVGVAIPMMSAEDLAEVRSMWSPDEETIAKEVAAYRGGWWEQMPKRVGLSFMCHTFLFGFYFFWRVGGTMLLGIALQKLSLLDASRKPWLYRTMVAAGLGVGLPLIGYGVWRNESENWDIAYAFAFGSQFNYWGSLLVAGAYLGAVMLACRAGRLGWLAPVGRMALTNYLCQSVVCTLVFYGHGLGQFGRFSRVQQLTLVAAIFTAQVFASNWWLSRYRYGPMEWLWRSLTYWKRQPIRLKPNRE